MSRLPRRTSRFKTCSDGDAKWCGGQLSHKGVECRGCCVSTFKCALELPSLCAPYFQALFRAGTEHAAISRKAQGVRLASILIMRRLQLLDKRARFRIPNRQATG